MGGFSFPDKFRWQVSGYFKVERVWAKVDVSGPFDLAALPNAGLGENPLILPNGKNTGACLG